MSRITHIRFFGLFVLMLTMFSMSALANSNKDYYSKVTATAVGAGKVYVSYNTQTNPTYAETSSAESGADSQKEAPTHTYYLYAQANSGHEFAGWFDNQNGTGTATSTSTTCSVTITAAENTPATKTYYALFKPVFKFSATANKIYDHGTATATVANSKIVGAVGDTQKSTTATFTATPNTGCTFVGWYYDEAHTNLASTSATYKPSINNTSAGSTANLTLYAWFKANQTLTWTQDPYDPNVVAGITYPGVAAATASSGLAVTYTSSQTSVATVNSSGDVTGVASSVDAVTITARQAGNDEYHAVEATRQFTVINKFQPTFDATGFQSNSSNNYTSYVDDTPTITVTNTTSDFTYVSSDPTVVSISKSGNVITLTALKVGTSTVTLNDPGNSTHYSASATYNITVMRVPNGLSASLASLTANPDGAIAVTFTDKNNANTPIVGTITNQVLSSIVNNGSDVITYANGVITAKNAGTAKITFTQAETDKYAEWTSSTYDITVTKLSNPISITLAGGSATNIKLKYGATASLSYTYANTTGATPTVTRTSGSYTTYSSGTITAGNTAGTDIYEITQAETYKYEAGYATFIIRVNNTDEATMYVLEDNSEHSIYTINNYTPAALSGPGDVLSFDAKRQTAAASYFYVMYSTDNGASYHELANPSLTTDYKNYSYSLPNGVTNIKFETHTGATLNKYVKNIKVTRKTYVEASTDDATSLSTVYTGETRTLTFTVNYSTTNGGNISINSNNDNFKVSTTELTTTSNSNGTKSFTVTYTPDPNSLGEESATITIADLFYSQTVTLTATAAKRANTLAVVGTQNLKVDDVVSNIYSGKNSNAALNVASSNNSVVSYDQETNKLQAIGAGTATLTFTQLENDSYYGATKIVTVNVSRYDQTLTWDNDLDAAARKMEVGDILSTNTAKASSGLAVTYTSSNPSALEVDEETGALTAKDGGANIVITATQEGNYKYNAASISRTFTVIKREHVTVTTTLTTGTNLFPLEGDNITIRPDALITEEALTIADETIVTASFGSNTFTLTALKEGTTTVRLVREQTEDFFALDVTYSIRVVKPVLVLDPTATPVISHEEYSSVTLSRTLKAGYSTIALPFTTTVEDIVGDGYDGDDDWVAQLQTVTSSAADGYTLYFSKVSGGVIMANQPYVLHLASTVTNPTWSNLSDGISVSAATAGQHAATTGYSGYADWVMHANYAPGLDMEGKYGIVNANAAMQRGGSGSTLNAYTAYITGPASGGNVKMRSAFVGEDGEMTVIEGVPTDDNYGLFDDDGMLTDEATRRGTMVYGIDGRRRQGITQGLNLIRTADGRTRKIAVRR